MLGSRSSKRKVAPDVELHKLEDPSSGNGSDNDAAAFEKAAAANYDRFAAVCGGGRLNTAQVHAALLLDVPPGSEVDERLFLDAVEDAGKSTDGEARWSREEFDGLVRFCASRPRSLPPPSVSKWFGAVLTIVFGAFTFWGAFPSGGAGSGAGSDSKLRRWCSSLRLHFLRGMYVPYSWRHASETDPFWFCVVQLGVTLWMVLVLAPFVMFIFGRKNDSTDNLTGQEAAICSGGMFLITGFLAATFAFTDHKDVEKLASLHLERVRLNGTEDQATAKDCAALVLQTRVTDTAPRTLSLSNVLALFFGLVLAATPTLVRVAIGIPWDGSCDHDGDALAAEVCGRLDEPLSRAIIVNGFVANTLIAAWFFKTMFQARAPLLARARLFRRVTDLLEGEDADSGGSGGVAVPVEALNFEEPSHVVAWGKVRRFAISFRRSGIRRVEAFMAVAAFIVVAFVTTFLYNTYRQPESRITYPSMQLMSVVMVGVLGTFLVHPVLSLGILVNISQSSWAEIVTEEAWRLQETVETAVNEASRAARLRAAKLCAALSMLLSNTDAAMRILGLPVTPALLNSVAVSLAAVGATWVVEVVRSK